MFPNPQSALPLPPRPSLERYRKIAKDLVKVCRAVPSAEADAASREEQGAVFEAWAQDWIEDLIRLCGLRIEPGLPVRVESWITGVAGFAQHKLANHGPRSCALADAQFVIARSHGFESWPKFVRCLEALEQSASGDTRFEAAADAIVGGDAADLMRLVRENAGLVWARSAREHGATLLHYAAANGVEGYRQRTPKNIAEIARMLLDAGAEVDATMQVYGGAHTTLGLAATSANPERAGVMEELLRTLLEYGAKIGDSLVLACLNNGRAGAAEFIASRVARLSLPEAAGVGQLDRVEAYFASDGSQQAGVSEEQRQQAFLLASAFGRDAVVTFLLRQSPNSEDLIRSSDRDGHTALHRAVIGGHPGTVRLLLEWNAPLEGENRYGGTPLGQALWSAAHGGDADVYVAILEALTAAGAKLPERHVPVNARVNAWLEAWLEQRGSKAEPEWHWYGEAPLRQRRGES